MDEKHISLPELLDNLSENIPPEEFHQEGKGWFGYPDDVEHVLFVEQVKEFWMAHHFGLDEKRRYSEAARALRKKLNPKSIERASVRPKWLTLTSVDGCPVEDPSIEEDGLKYLADHIKGYSTEQSRLSEHLHFCSDAGVNPLHEGLRGESFRSSEWKFLQGAGKIGFDLSEIVNFLDQNGLAHTLGNDKGWSWKEIADELGVSISQAQIMNKATGAKYIKPPGTGGRNHQSCLTTKSKLQIMQKKYDEMKKK